VVSKRDEIKDNKLNPFAKKEETINFKSICNKIISLSTKLYINFNFAKTVLKNL
jgi:hypothetical protein